MALTEDEKKKIQEEEAFRKQVKTELALNNQTSGDKNKLVAALLALFLGGLGIHKFYLGRTGWGIIYLLFCLIIVKTPKRKIL